MSSKSRPKFRKRRIITREELFPEKANHQFLMMKHSIECAIPDEKERLEYIDALIKKLGE